MNPDTTLTEITDRMATDELGEMYFKQDDGEWESLDDITVKSEQGTDRFIRGYFKDALNSDGDMVYVRSVAGRLQWLKGNSRGTEQKWVELTPNLAKRIDAGLRVEEFVDSLDSFKTEAIVEEKPKFENGWYQDSNGKLYQFDGVVWLGDVPSNKLMESLEYLG